MNNWYVVITELGTGKEEKRMGPMDESAAERTLRGVIRQINDERYCATMEEGAAA